MRQGTTPENSFTLPFQLPDGTEYRVVYAQGEEYNETILFEKTTQDCIIEGNKVKVRLTAEETMLFDCTPRWHKNTLAPIPVWIQIGYTTPGGETNWSDIIETTPERVLKKDGVV